MFKNCSVLQRILPCRICNTFCIKFPCQKKCQKTNESGTHHKPPTNKIQDLIMHINATEKTGRIIFLDQVKAIMIALVIATHTILVGTLFTTDLKQIIEAAPAYEAISFWFGWICGCGLVWTSFIEFIFVERYMYILKR